MAGFIELEVTGVDKVISLFVRVNRALDEEAILDVAGAVLLNRTRTRFLDQVDADGNKWEVSDAARARRASGRDGGTLFDTGTLFHSLHLYKTRPGERAIGTDVFYGAQHQLGLFGFPQREFLGFNQDDANVLKQVVLSRLKAATSE